MIHVRNEKEKDEGDNLPYVRIYSFVSNLQYICTE